MRVLAQGHCMVLLVYPYNPQEININGHYLIQFLPSITKSSMSSVSNMSCFESELNSISSCSQAIDAAVRTLIFLMLPSWLTPTMQGFFSQMTRGNVLLRTLYIFNWNLRCYRRNSFVSIGISYALSRSGMPHGI